MQVYCLKCKLRETRSPSPRVSLLLSSFAYRTRFVDRARALMHGLLWVYASGRYSILTL